MAARSAGSSQRGRGGATVWGSVSGARWAGPARVSTTARSSPPSFRGPMLSASTRAVGRRLLLRVMLLSTCPPVRLSAQGFLSQFSYDNLKPSALQLDLGPVGGNNIRGTLIGGLRLDYGFIAPHVRVLLGVSYRSEEHTSELQSRLHLVCRLLLEKT